VIRDCRSVNPVLNHKRDSRMTNREKMDQNQQGPPRRHFHRGRRGPDRRGPDRRGPQPQAPEQPARGEVDVEQIMRDIRARISQRHGIELTSQQIQDLAARRLESILDPRSVKPALLDQLRRASGTPADTAPRPTEPPYSFEGTTLYESHRGLMRFIRKLLNPILKLFFNPNPLIQALNIQARLNTEALAREAERDRRQSEWNALHYEILQRVVTETARVTLEVQSLAMKVDSLAAKVDFNERRVRSIEGALHQARPSPRRDAPEPPPVAAAAISEAAATEAPPPQVPGPGQPSEGTRRRRRRRRGRRGTGAPVEAVGGAGEPAETGSLDADADGGDQDEGPDEDELASISTDANVVSGEPESVLVAEALVVTEEVRPAFPVQVQEVAPPTEPPVAEPIESPAPPPERSDIDPTDR
jgi:hypothetical protein